MVTLMLLGRLLSAIKLPIAKYLFRLTGEYETSRDLAQDTFIQAFKSLRKSKAEILLKAWLLRNCYQ